MDVERAGSSGGQGLLTEGTGVGRRLRSPRLHWEPGGRCRG